MWLEELPEGRAWLRELPRLVQDCAARWRLELGEPFPYAFASVALPARCEDGSDAVLKVQFPDDEGAHEAAALAVWDGRGAVRLLAYDEERRALLLERCRPGTSLAEIPADAALDVLAGLLPRLWAPAAGPFRSVTELAPGWAAGIEAGWGRTGRPFERDLVDAALDALTALPGSQGEQVLVNQDLHAQNVLGAEREPWLVIDPKPLVGEREFSLVPIVRGAELGESRADVLGRLDRLTGELGLDRERVRGWTLAHTLAWGFDGGETNPWHVQVARWLAR